MPRKSVPNSSLDGRVSACTGAADSVVRSFTLRADGALVVDWEQLVPDR